MERLAVIKIGGRVIDDDRALARFLDDFAQIPACKILVHGGGALASRTARALGIEPKMVDGRRITDADMLEVVIMVYGGRINRQIVAGLQARGCNAIGLTGADGNIIAAEKRRGWEVDFGFVGDITAVRADRLVALLNAGFTPVVAPLTHDGRGQLLNTNADTMASALASALAADYATELYYCFEQPGVLLDIAQPQSRIAALSKSHYERLKVDGVITRGMLPKLDTAFAALQSGARRVKICCADELIAAMNGTHAVGTELTRE